MNAPLNLTAAGIVQALTFKARPVLMDFLDAHPKFKRFVALRFEHLRPSDDLAFARDRVSRCLEIQRKRRTSGISGAPHYGYGAAFQIDCRQLLDAIDTFTAKQAA